MPNVIGEKNLVGSIPEKLVEEFWATVPKGLKGKYVLEAAAKLWISLPSEIRAKLLNQTLSETAFIELIKEIVDERIEAKCQTGKAKRSSKN